ncbi:SusC/RagA family TonB-linked outer membrane protein [Chitinophaga silvatica]|uniref:SusC/RagA family TonB-linked outer membrane protein n=1 Tax=Chitinophaga silvatica TaxID=2282649 RepID=A0A3E1YGW1_9BACT|nr:SusC/RagA family TonB-linked outer membrane protein [Chitinophaga silvatica]RFS26631.1 SusC/RagA family TonB-linked outer membrane protein [Chitinophaga silvatica]
MNKRLFRDTYAHKIRSIGRRTGILAILICCMLSSAIAQQKGITLEMKNAKRTEILNKIRDQITYSLVFNSKELNKYAPINITAQNQPIEQVLEKVLEGTGLKYSIDGKVIIISNPGKQIAAVETLVTVKGRITSPDNVPLPGVTLVEVGSTKATTSDASGYYNIFVQDKSSIRVSYIGMKSVTFAVNGGADNSFINNIQLEKQDINVSEVVVTGYQNIDRKDMVGSYSRISADEIKIPGVNSIDKLLQGQLPGVAVTQSSGLVGSKTKVRTRGTSTMLGSQDPVWVVDGIIQNDPIPFQYQQFNALQNEGDQDALKNLVGTTVSYLNVDDIQDITVLKDASSTAIYGVKAANGVIVITTRKGKAGRTAINFSSNTTISQRPSYRDFNLMNSKDRIDVSREIYARGLNFQQTPDAVSYEGALQRLFDKQITQEQFDREVSKFETMNTDWFGLLYQNPVSNNQSLSFSGGADRTSYYGSVGMMSQIGNTIGNEQRRYNALLKVTTALSNKVRLTFNLNASTSNLKGFYKFEPFQYAFNTSRAIPYLDDNGSQYFYINNNSASSGGIIPASYKYNVINERNNTGSLSKAGFINGTYNIDYAIGKGFSFQSVGNYGISNSNGESFATERSAYISSLRGYEFGQYTPSSLKYQQSSLPIGGQLNKMSAEMKSYLFRNMLSYTNRFFGNRDGFNAMAGVEIRSVKYDGVSQTSYGYMPDRGKTIVMPPLNVALSTGGTTTNSLYNNMVPLLTDKLNNYLSYFGTTSYNLNNKYVFNASIRTDASNRFGQDTRHRFLPVWAAGGQWNLAEENFLKSNSWLNQLSLRASYGFQGNVAENFSPDLIAQIPSGNSAYSATTKEAILKIYSLAYEDLRWERSKTSNLALDFSILKGRVSGTVEGYYKKTSDAIIMLQVPFEFGMLTGVPVNGGDLLNKGYEVTLNIVPIRNKNFSWNLRINSGRNFNEVKESGATVLSNWQMAASGSIYKKGYPISAFWAFDYAGLNEKGIPQFNNLDKSAEKTIDATSGMVYMGQLDPKITGGVSNNFQYKGFSLNVLFNVALGHKKFLPRIYETMYGSAPYPAKNLSNELVNRWRQPGDEKNTNIPSLPTALVPNVSLPFGSGSLASPYLMYDYSNLRVVDASFVRLQNLMLGYNIPGSWLKQTKVIRQANLMLSASNLFYIASKDLHGVDPEVNGNSLPIPRNYSLTVNVGF